MKLKTKFHHLIDQIDNYEVLEDFYTALNDYCERDHEKDIIDDLTEAQEARLNESIRQCESGATIPHQTMKTEIKQWLFK